jgi:16S rRNA (uracil1498-N3)-methyltransferase
VLRARAGDALIVFNGQGGEYSARVESVQRSAVAVRIGAHDQIERESPLEVTLLQGIARGEKMDQILQKATELGVTRVVPVITTRSNVRLDEDAALRKQQHWRSVVMAACEQCGRNRLPEVSGPMALAAALAASRAELRMVMAPDEDAIDLHGLLAGAPANAPSIAFVVGPEGGLDAVEIDAAKRHGFTPCRLGPRVLRTETAALAVLAALQFTCGDLAGTPR